MQRTVGTDCDFGVKPRANRLRLPKFFEFLGHVRANSKELGQIFFEHGIVPGGHRFWIVREEDARRFVAWELGIDFLRKERRDRSHHARQSIGHRVKGGLR